MKYVRSLGAMALVGMPSLAMAMAIKPGQEETSAGLAIGLAMLGMAAGALLVVLWAAMRAPRAGLIAALGFIAVLVVCPAFAQAPETRVPLGGFYEIARPYLETITAAAVVAALGWILDKLHTKFKIEIPKARRDTLHLALTQGAGLLIQLGYDYAKGAYLDVKNPKLAQAIRYVEKSAPDAVRKFKLPPEEIAEKLIAKVPQIAAAGK